MDSNIANTEDAIFSSSRSKLQNDDDFFLTNVKPNIYFFNNSLKSLGSEILLNQHSLPFLYPNLPYLNTTNHLAFKFTFKVHETLYNI
jgi:hypothetical protein